MDLGMLVVFAIWVLIAILVVWGVDYFLRRLALAPMVRTIILIILGLIILILFINRFAPGLITV